MDQKIYKIRKFEPEDFNIFISPDKHVLLDPNTFRNTIVGNVESSMAEFGCYMPGQVLSRVLFYIGDGERDENDIKKQLADRMNEEFYPHTFAAIDDSTYKSNKTDNKSELFKIVSGNDVRIPITVEDDLIEKLQELKFKGRSIDRLLTVVPEKEVTVNGRDETMAIVNTVLQAVEESEIYKED
jgi:hypothetical protein